VRLPARKLEAEARAAKELLALDIERAVVGQRTLGALYLGHPPSPGLPSVPVSEVASRLPFVERADRLEDLCGTVVDSLLAITSGTSGTVGTQPDPGGPNRRVACRRSPGGS
jgi:hypothetical protein